MSQRELLQIAERLSGLIPRLARGLSAAANGVSHNGSERNGSSRNGSGSESPRRQRREKDPADDLPLAQLRLCGILHEGARPMSALSRELGVSLSALTQIADRLERAALVKRTTAADDRRVRCLQLTPRGQAMMRKRHEARLRRSLALLEHLSPPERQQVLTAMNLLVNACACAQGDPRRNGSHSRAPSAV